MKPFDKLGLYIHIPFCRQKCSYCDFVSFADKETLIEKYVESLKDEIRITADYCKGYKISTIFIGGGTPSYIDQAFIHNILQEAGRFFNIDNVFEISMESNPGTLYKDNLRAYKSMGINRLSIGLQACQNSLLKKLGRIHDYEQFLKSYTEARNSGFKNINVDLIFGLPGQTLCHWQKTLNKVLELKPEHISCYSLKIEENTPFFKIYGPYMNGRNKALRNPLPSEDEEREMYHYAVSFLKSKGYKHYEISNFCLPEHECRHNLIYWECKPYIGIGAGAHSYFQGSRFHNKSSVEEYITDIKSNKISRVEEQRIGLAESKSEYIVLGLRLIKGINKKEFSQRFGMDIQAAYGKQIQKLEGLGLLKNGKHKISLTAKGLDLANQVMVEFI